MKIVIFKPVENVEYETSNAGSEAMIGGFKIKGATAWEKMSSYEADAIDDTSANRSHLEAEPMAKHFILPEGMDADVVTPVLIPAVGEENNPMSEPPYVAAHYVLQEDAAKVAAKAARLEAEAKAKTIADVAELGKKARACCQEVLDYVAGVNMTRVMSGSITPAQTVEFETTFTEAFAWLSKNYVTKAKTAIVAVPVDGVLVTQSIYDDVLAIFAKYNF